MISPHHFAPELATTRLKLVGQTRKDFDLHCAFFQTERAKFVGGPRNREQVWNDLMNVTGQWAVDGIGGWAIKLSKTGQTIGQIAICQPPSFPELELGWILYDGFEGRGYAHEAASAALVFFAQNVRRLL